MSIVMELLPPAAEIPEHHTTLRADLWEAGFRRGIIVHQTLHGRDPSVLTRYHEKPDMMEATSLHDGSDVLDEVFYGGHGIEKNPCIIAQDDEGLYFYDMYDGATDLCRIRNNAEYYLTAKEWIPQPGG